jgi:acetyltransferase-like isoleucine patch superfamily enzyme
MRCSVFRLDLCNRKRSGYPVASLSGAFVHPTAEIAVDARLGDDCRVWRLAHIRERAVVGDRSIIGAGVYVGADVHMGHDCKIQNDALLYEGLTLEDGVFVGPQVCFTNDRLPRAVNPDLSLKAARDWSVSKTFVREGASVGAQSVVVAGVTIGCWALVGAGSLVTHDVPPHALVFGHPARIHGWVCHCARRLTVLHPGEGWCEACQRQIALPAEAR